MDRVRLRRAVLEESDRIGTIVGWPSEGGEEKLQGKTNEMLEHWPGQGRMCRLNLDKHYLNRVPMAMASTHRFLGIRTQEVTIKQVSSSAAQLAQVSLIQIERR